MSTITLRDYHQFIENLIQKNSNAEAIFHCTNILSSYPKSIKTYQQLGQALLENKRFADAAEVFSKILTVFPDDFVAHAGLSAVFEENRELDKAIWHMEQAFETQPSNPTIQDEFRRLISRRDGNAPSKIRLTRGALIRMYAKGELYQQAVAEAQSALQLDPDRIDLKLLLARMYTLTDSPAEAAEICAEIIQDNPYCFEANRIMFELSSTAEDPENYDPVFHQRLSELDPYYSFIGTSSENVEVIPAENIILEKPEYISKDEDFSLTPEWADRIGIPWHEETDIPVTSEIELDTIESDSIDENLAAGSTLPTPFIEDADNAIIDENYQADGPTDGNEEELPEWIAKAGWIRATDEETPPLASDFEDEPDLSVDAPDVNLAEPAQDLPDWLRSLNPEGGDSPQIFASTGQESIPEAEIPPLPPEMLAELLSEEYQQNSNFAASEPNEEPQIFESDNVVLEKSSIETLITTNDEPIPDLPDWLKDLDTGDFQVEIPEVASEVGLSAVIEAETAPQPVSAEVNVPDFIDEIGNTDLIGEIETTNIEETIQEEIYLLPDEEIEEVLTSSSMVESVTEEISTVISSQEIEPEKELVKPAIPSWVKNILSSSAVAAPAISPVPSSFEESVTQPQSTPEFIESTIEELITDLPGEHEGEGAISEEVTAELETWIKDISPQEVEESITAADAAIITPVFGDEAPEISLESLTEPAIIGEDQVPSSEIEAEPVSEEVFGETAIFDDRLSSMVTAESEQPIPVSELEGKLEIEPLQTVETDIEKVINLLKTGEYPSYLDEVSKTELPDDISDKVISELNTVLQNDPGNIDLWQNLGDLQTKKSNLTDAINAYREAEKQIFY